MLIIRDDINGAEPQPTPVDRHTHSTKDPAEITDRLHLALISRCESVLGRKIECLAFPGGESRASFRCIFSDETSVIVTRRESRYRAQLEEKIMRVLWQAGAPVPKVLDFNGLVLIQSDEGADKLGSILNNSNKSSIHEGIISDAAISLLNIHQAAREANLAHNVPMLGTDAGWVRALIDRPAVIGSFLDLEAPEPDLDAMFQILTLVEPGFVKWDSRPANAVLNRAGEMCWVDWEHAGARNPLDDLVHLICDENVILDTQAEERLLQEFAPRFSNMANDRLAIEYCRVAGVLHLCVRLSLILDEYDQYGWGDADRCASKDKIGSSKEQALRLCKRGQVWAASTPVTLALSPWFSKLGKHISKYE